jgi:cobalt-zinc-cadmium resistance protein CzcA
VNPKKPKAQLIEEVDEAVKQVVGTGVEIEQPVQLRRHQLISGVKSDMAVKFLATISNCSQQPQKK